jgi:hypothetical protein
MKWIIIILMYMAYIVMAGSANPSTGTPYRSSDLLDGAGHSSYGTPPDGSGGVGHTPYTTGSSRIIVRARQIR